MPQELVYLGEYLFWFFTVQLAILWLALPVLVLGIRKRMADASAKMDRINEEVTLIRGTLEGMYLTGTRIRPDAIAPTPAPEAASSVIQTTQNTSPSPTTEPKEQRRQEPSLRIPEATFDKAPGNDAAEPKAPTKEPSSSGDARVAAEALLKATTRARQQAQESESVKLNGHRGAAEVSEEEKSVRTQAQTASLVGGVVSDDEDFIDDSVDVEDDSLDYEGKEDDPVTHLINVTAKSKKRTAAPLHLDNIAGEFEISEDEEGYFIYRSRRYERLIDAMRQQHIDIKKGEAPPEAAEGVA